jgi:outer membrane autotransporter protein
VLNLTSGLGQIPGLTRNQSAVATALDTSFNLGRGTLPTLLGVPLSQMPQALTSLSGEGVTGAQETAFGAANVFMSLLMDQGAFWRSGSPVDPYGVSFAQGDDAALAYAAPGKKDKPIYKTEMPAFPQSASQPRWRAWFTGYDATWRLNGQADSGSANLNHNTAGAAGGFDYQLNPNLLLGFAFGGASSSFAASDRATSGQQEAGQFGVYGVHKWGQLYAAGALSLGVYDTSTTRTILGVGPTQQATGRFSSAAVTGRLEVGWRLSWMKELSVTPFAAVQVAQLWQSSFTETNVAPAGVGPLGLNYDARTATSLPIHLGAQFDTRYQLSNGMLLLPYARVAWVHEFNRARDLAASFIALPDAAFSVEGARLAANAARVNVGSSIAIKRNVSLFANFDGEFASSSQSYAGKGGFRATW